MTRVDFYVLKAGSARQRSVFACRLTEKAFGLGHKIYLHTGSGKQTHQLSELLWTFRDGSFVPHLEFDQSAAHDSDDDTPVHIGHGDEPGQHADLLINLADEVPLFFSRFERVAEIVAADSRDHARDRFRFYRDRGYALETHNL
ncbi:MAG: DNA polymerase III subunit chi [Gammaproteobacteria bacterium]